MDDYMWQNSSKTTRVFAGAPGKDRTMPRRVPVGDLVTSSEAARALGVGPSTIKRWADEGALRVFRTRGGHRRFAREDLHHLLSKRLVEARGTNGEDPVEEWFDLLLAETDPHAIQGRLYLDRAELGSWWSVGERIGSVLHRIGSAWATGRISISQEHQASELLTRGLSWCVSTLPVLPGSARALLATVEGEAHTLGLHLVELTLRELGWTCVWLGANTPTRELQRVVESASFTLVCVSASRASRDSDLLRRAARHLHRSSRKHGATLVVGGGGAWPDPFPWGTRLGSLGELHQLAARLASRRAVGGPPP